MYQEQRLAELIFDGKTIVLDESVLNATIHTLGIDICASFYAATNPS